MNNNVPADPETLTRVYRSLRLIRRMEEKIVEIYPSDKIKSPVHLSIGQESVSVGVCDVLNPDDVVGATYRGHAAYIGKGGDIKRMMAELYGKGTGCGAGKAGSMHLVDMSQNILGMSAVVGSTVPVAAGYAHALKQEGKRRIVVCFFGDGATDEGVIYETLNFSSLRKLPILFVCENNGYAIHSPVKNRWATEMLCERVRTYGIPATHLADDNVFTVRDVAEKAVAAIRAGEGPQFMECKTYRWLEHVGIERDYDDGYRDRDEFAPWLANDQVVAVGNMLAGDQRQAIDDEVESLVAEAVDFAETSPWPEPEDLYKYVFAD